MRVEIVAYQPHHIPAVKAFNRRLQAAQVPLRFAESEVSAWLPAAPGERLYRELFLALEGETVRGGYVLKHQDFAIGPDVVSVGNLQHPLSEGAFDPAYALLGIRLLRDALRRQPLLYALGIGGHEERAARLLTAAKFGVETVPFLFRVEHAGAFLRQIQPLRSSLVRRLACDVGAATGLGALGLRLLQRPRGPRVARPGLQVEHPAAFDAEVEAVWRATAGVFELAAVRDHHVLARLYDQPGNRFLRVVIHDAGGMRGWAVLLASRKTGDKYFGDTQLGSIVDLLAAPGYELPLVAAALERLRGEDVDIIVTNQALGAVREALRQAGFLAGPSNFLFCSSPALQAMTGLYAEDARGFHLSRGDGDGPIHL